MSVERVIGVDLGTSTSVIRVKRYQDEKPLGDRLMTLPVTFNMGSTIVPTLIQKVESGAYYGFDAQVARRRSTLFQNFKINLENADTAERERARSLISEYLSYLGREYRGQSDGGHLGEVSDMERTIISYPVKWGGESRTFLIDAAKKAGFPNVEGMDEAQAAIGAVTVQNAAYLKERGYFQDEVPINILLLDMGAGTTDLVLCRYTPGSGAIEIKSTWPKGGEALFGGREVDERLMQYIRSKIPADEAGTVLKRCGLEQFKVWKETILSPALKQGNTADEFSALDSILDLLGIDAEDYSIDRAVFENIMEDYLRAFPQLVNDCLSDADLSGEDVDLVILTGGHSQWYFVREMLTGAMPRFGKINLEKIQRDTGRIVPIPLPQETVALGLAYSRMSGDKIDKNHTDGNFEAKRPEVDKKPAPDKSVSAFMPVKPASVQPTPAPVSADDEPTPAEEFALGNAGQDYEIVKYLGKREHVVIPEKIRGRKVSSIGSEAFAPISRGANTAWSLTVYGAFVPLAVGSFSKLRSITIPKSVKKIGDGAFYQCRNLTSVKLHEGIEEIGDSAFAETAVTFFDFGERKPEPNVVRFPRGLKRIGKGAFGNQRRDYTLSKKSPLVQCGPIP